MTATVPAPTDDRAPAPTAGRLLTSSARNSYDPLLDIDWDAGPVAGRPHMSFERMSLYGTPLWRTLSDEQRVELSKHEVISIARVGLWFEILLMGMLTRHLFDQDPASARTRYALTEIGDETRHSVMFARWADGYGGIEYGPGRRAHQLGRFFRAVAPTGPAMWAGTLIAEELLDRLQREMMADDAIQPLSRMIARIHVVEEARHVRFAREELTRSVEDCSTATRRLHGVLTAGAAEVIVSSLVHPRVYASVGLDPTRARAEARSNPHHHATLRWMGERIMPVLAEAGMADSAARILYRRAHLL